MSSVAQRLCDEIVEPVFQTSSRLSRQNPIRLMQHCPSKPSGKTTRSVVIEKKKVLNKITPQDSFGSKVTIKQLKSKETILKKNFTDTAINTLVTGPLKCDNDCVTIVRKRDNRCSCKCGQKRINSKASVKQIQTFDAKVFLHTDKACEQCVETVSCGTQFLEKLTKTASKTSNLKLNKKTKTTHQVSSILRKESYKVIESHNRFPNMSPIGTRRWALSQYPARGPDF